MDPEDDEFTLDYGHGQISVEIDGWEWYDDSIPVLTGDTAALYGEVEQPLFFDASIEADSMFVQGMGIYFYASPPADRPDVMLARGRQVGTGLLSVVYCTRKRWEIDMSDQVTAKELGLNVSSGDEKDVFKWFLASFLFGKRIQQDIAVKTYKVIVEKHGRDTPRKLCNCTWQELVDMLGEGNYTRYDESTAERLLKLCEKLNDEYDGKVSNIHEASENRKDLEKRLEEFEGVGPKTVEIFMREAAKRW